MKEDRETLQQEAETHDEALKDLEGDVTALREKFHDSLQQVMCGMFEARDQVVEQANGCCLVVFIPDDELYPFKAALEGNSRGDMGASTHIAKALLFFSSCSIC